MGSLNYMIVSLYRKGTGWPMYEKPERVTYREAAWPTDPTRNAESAIRLADEILNDMTPIGLGGLTGYEWGGSQ